jgi:DNA-binding NarL/FixJ family response regulator
MIEVMIASNSPVVREGLKSILGESAGVHVRIIENGLPQPIAPGMPRGIDVLIVDLAAAGPGNGFDLIQQARHDHPGLPLLALDARFEGHTALYALRAGVSGYLSQQSAPSELLAAVGKVAAGERYLSPALAEILAQRLDRAWQRPPHELLSLREWQVFRLLASGRSPSQIAAAMMLSVKTISTYRARILEKMNLKTTAELMYYAVQNRIAETGGAAGPVALQQ